MPVVSTYNSDKIRMLSFLMALLVVAIHCTSMPPDWYFAVDRSFGRSQAWTAIRFLLSHTITHCAVPLFFIISGFMMFRNYEKGFVWWKCLVAKKVFTLIVPYFLWNAAYFVFKVVVGRYIVSFDMNGIAGSLGLIIGWPIGGDLACGQFWYIRCLIVYSLFAPLFGFLYKNIIVGSLCMGLLFFMWVVGFSGVGYQILDTQVVLMFSCGCYLGFHSNKLSVGLDGRCPLTLLLLSIVVQMYAFITRNQDVVKLTEKIVLLSGLLSFWFSFDKIIEIASHFMRPVLRYGFFVYASHCIFVSICARICDAIIGDHHRWDWTYIILLVVVPVFSVATGVLVRRLSPTLFKVMTGGR